MIHTRLPDDKLLPHAIRFNYETLFSIKLVDPGESTSTVTPFPNSYREPATMVAPV
jgi:hypothetical protein